MKKGELARRLVEELQAERALEPRTDAEVAELVNTACDDIDMTSPLFAVLQSVIGRLKRSGGLSFTPCAWCDREAMRGRSQEDPHARCQLHLHERT